MPHRKLPVHVHVACTSIQAAPVTSRHVQRVPPVHVHVVPHPACSTASQLPSSGCSTYRHIQRPRHHRVARVASHRELVRRNRQRPVRCRHRKLPTVHVHVACHIHFPRAQVLTSTSPVSPATSSVLDSCSRSATSPSSRSRSTSSSPPACRQRELVCHIHVHVPDPASTAPELRLLNVVPPASSVPATTVLPVLPATVNLFDEIAS